MYNAINRVSLLKKGSSLRSCYKERLRKAKDIAASKSSRTVLRCRKERVPQAFPKANHIAQDVIVLKGHNVHLPAVSEGRLGRLRGDNIIEEFLERHTNEPSSFIEDSTVDRISDVDEERERVIFWVKSVGPRNFLFQSESGLL